MFTQGIRKNLTIFLLLLLFALSIPRVIFSQTKTAKINEIFPAPSITPTPETKEGYEWVEIVNTGSEPIYSYEIVVMDAKGSILENNFDSIPANQYATAISSKVLNNRGGDKVYLCINGVLADYVTYPSISQGYSYARCPDKTGEFVKLSESDVTEGSANNCSSITPAPSPTPTPTPALTCPPTSPTPTPLPTPTYTPTPLPTPSPTPTPTPSPASSEVNFTLELSEVYPNPYSSENEWVEIYNPNDFEVQALNWQIDDVKGASSPISFSAVIPAKGYTVIEIPKAIFNNSGDDVRLLDPTGKEIDKFTYTLSQKGFSFAKDSSGKWCLQEPTKGKNNLTCKSDPKEESNSSSKKNSPTLPSPTPFPKTLITSNSDQNITIYFNTYQPPSVLGSTTIKKSSPIEFDTKNQSKLFSASFFAFHFNLLTLLYLSFKILKLL